LPRKSADVHLMEVELMEESAMVQEGGPRKLRRRRDQDDRISK